MRRKRGGHGGGHSNSERWLLTYADMITLLVAFFIMMYSMSVLNLAKFRQVAISIRSGFGGEMDGGGRSVLNPSVGMNVKPSVLPHINDAQTKKVLKQMQSFIKEKKLQSALRLTPTEHGLIVSMVTDKMLFRKGEADLDSEAAQILDKIVSLIAKSNYYVRVEGHTDNLPISTSRFPSNWELSTTRATTVVRYMIEHSKIEPWRLSASGYADSRPLVPNNNEQNRMYNRRVDIVLIKGGEPVLNEKGN